MTDVPLLSANRKNRAVFFEKLRLYKLYCQATGQGQADGPSYLDVSPSRNPKQQGLSKKDPRINDAQLEVPTFEASATNIGHKDYAPPPKEPSDNDFPMTKTGILSSRFLTLPANFSFFFISPLLCQGLGGYEAFDHRGLCGHGGEPVIWGTGGS